MQRTDIGRHADIDFLDGEIGFLRGKPQVAGGDHVDTAADTGAMNCGYHRKPGALNRGERILELHDLGAQRKGGPAGLLFEQGRDGTERGKVHAAGEVLSLAADDYGTNGFIGIEFCKEAWQFGPEIRRHAVGLLRAVHREPHNGTFSADKEKGR